MQTIARSKHETVVTAINKLHHRMMFTSRDLAQTTELPLRAVSVILSRLRQIGAIKIVGKDFSKCLLYQRKKRIKLDYVVVRKK